MRFNCATTATVTMVANSFAKATWAKLVALVWRLWFSPIAEPWDESLLARPFSPAVRKMMARARLDNMRERGVMICWSYSRDRMVERRELKHESDELKSARLRKAQRDRAGRGMWLVA